MKLTIDTEQNVDWNALGQAIDTTFGRSSTNKNSSYSVKVTLLDAERMLVSYAVVVNFGAENEKQIMKQRYEEESNKIISDVLKKIKSEYKDLAGETVSFKEVSSDVMIEMLTASALSPRRTAYYRRKTVFQIA